MLVWLKNKRGVEQGLIALAVFLIVIDFALLTAVSPSWPSKLAGGITGSFIADDGFEKYTQDLNLKISDDDSYNLELENYTTGASLKYLKLSGSWETTEGAENSNAEFKAYLVDSAGNKYLIADSDSIKPSAFAGITALFVSEEKTAEKEEAKEEKAAAQEEKKEEKTEDKQSETPSEQKASEPESESAPAESESSPTPSESAPAAETPATEEPAPETPAQETPIEETPPVETPPTETPTEQPPVEEPPVEVPPAEQPPQETPLAEEPPIEEILPELNITEEFNITEEINATELNVTEINLTELPINFTINTTITIEFENECAETCLLVDGLMASNYTLLFEVNGGVLEIDSVDYALKPGNETINFTKVKDDPSYDLIIDSANLTEDGSLVVEFHHDYDISLPIAVDSEINYTLSTETLNPAETATLTAPSYNDEYFRIKIGEHSEAFAFGKPKEQNIEVNVKGAQNQDNNATIKLVDKFLEKEEKSFEANKASKVKKGEYDVVIAPDSGPISAIQFDNITVNSDSVINIGVDNVPEFGSYVKVYAIDPTQFNFTNATVTATATGSELYKCKSWDFATQSCIDGIWVKLMDIVPGQDYSFSLTPEDPGFGETLQPNATTGKDAFLWQNNAAKNYGASTFIGIDNENAKSEWGILEFNLSNIPQNAAISSAVLELYQTTDAGTTFNVVVYRITNSWKEGTGTGTTNSAAINGTTWDERFYGTNWGTAGGDYASTVYTNVTIDTSINTWKTLTITTLVKEWVNGTYSNYGLILVPQGPYGVNAEKQFASSDNTNATILPKLTINYSTALTITFVGQTPANGVTVNASSVFVNASITNGNATTAKLEWNNTNYTMNAAASLPSASWYLNKTGLTNDNYSYKVYANDSQTGVFDVSETRTVIVNACAENWTVSYGSCLTNDTKLKYYTDGNSCGTYGSLPVDNGTYVSCNYCSQNITGPYNTSCATNDNRTQYYTDQNYASCCAITGLTSDCSINNATYANQTLSCDYCAPSWYEINTSCQVTDTITGYYADSNSCYAQTGLESDNNPPANNSYGCNYCSYSVTNSSWTEWQNQGSCLTNDTQLQNKSRTEYDANYASCYAVTGLPSDLWNSGNNNTYWEYNSTSCDYCSPSWYETNASCAITDTITGYFTDSNNCFGQTGLESDNNKPVNNSYSCDNCTPNSIEINESCQPTYNLTKWYNDTNKCYEATGLDSDLPPANETLACEYVIRNEFSGDSTDFTAVNLSNITSLTLDAPISGKIIFAETISINRSIDIDAAVNISYNFISLDPTLLPEFNKSAVLYFRNINFTDPKPMRNGADCPSAICTEVGYTNNTYVFTVTGWSSYSAGENLYCGDGSCNNGETCTSCATDCGSCSTGGGGRSGGGGYVTCAESWSCTDWGPCMNGKSIRVCQDTNSCGTTTSKPAIVEDCVAACAESWQCEEWSECGAEELQTRTCLDQNSCGTALAKPEEKMSCAQPAAGKPEKTEESPQLIKTLAAYKPQNPLYVVPLILLLISLIGVIGLNRTKLSKTTKIVLTISHIVLIVLVLIMLTLTFFENTIVKYIAKEIPAISANVNRIAIAITIIAAAAVLALAAVFVKRKIFSKKHEKHDAHRWKPAWHHDKSN